MPARKSKSVKSLKKQADDRKYDQEIAGADAMSSDSVGAPLSPEDAPTDNGFRDSLQSHASSNANDVPSPVAPIADSQNGKPTITAAHDWTRPIHIDQGAFKDDLGRTLLLYLS